MMSRIDLRLTGVARPCRAGVPTRSPAADAPAAPRSGAALTSPEGLPLRRTFRQRFWLPALRAADLPVNHFHDLRHTGNTLAASSGAGLRELMDRMGHSTTRAAMIYLHGSDERQRALAEALSKLAEGSEKRPSSRQSGTQHASTGTLREDQLRAARLGL